MLIARMHCGADASWRLSGCLCFASDVCSSLDRRSWNVICLPLRRSGWENCLMHIFRGIRMVVVRMMMRAMCHCEVHATCFPEGGVPTKLLNWITKPLIMFLVSIQRHSCDHLRIQMQSHERNKNNYIDFDWDWSPWFPAFPQALALPRILGKPPS